MTDLEKFKNKMEFEVSQKISVVTAKLSVESDVVLGCRIRLEISGKPDDKYKSNGFSFTVDRSIRESFLLEEDGFAKFVRKSLFYDMADLLLGEIVNKTA